MKRDSQSSTDEQRWSAVLHRDRNADGRFLYSVKTTGVYCRPSCSARRALRENVAFHSSCEEAERLGYRACKRCRPREAGLAREPIAGVVKACREIEGNPEVPNLKALSQLSGLSPFHFQRVFKAVTGVTPKVYAAAVRATRTRQALMRGSTVTEALYEGGFNTSSRFYQTSPEFLGMSPARFRDGGRGEEIQFAVGKCSWGSILVAATDVGICAILLGDNPGTLERELQNCFPAARLNRGNAKFGRCVANVIEFAETPGSDLDLPLDIRGTVFQKRVWDAIRTIPKGSTASYADLARRIGRPKSSRAVANACASNKIAILIPCHRVVRTDGSSAGYRWGTKRKKELLKREGAIIRAKQ